MKKEIQDLDEFIQKTNKVKQSKRAMGFSVKEDNGGFSTRKEIADNDISSSVRVTASAEKVETVQETEQCSETSKSEDKLQELLNSLESRLSEKYQKEIEDIKNQFAPVQSALAASEEKAKVLETALNQTKEELKEASAKASVLDDLKKFAGVSMASPQPLSIGGEGSPAMRNYEKLFNSAPSKIVATDSSVGAVTQKDLRLANDYWRKNKQEISDGVEAVLKNAGYLQGSGRVLNAATVPSDIPSIAFTHLSNYVRENTYEDLIHWQFANEAAAPGTPPSLNTAVPRYPYFARPTTVASRQLTTGTDLHSGAQNVTERNALITIEELGLGKDVNNQPVGLTSFTTAFSMANLEQIVNDNLGMDYQYYNDLRLWSLWFLTNSILYPGVGGSVISNSGTLTANDGIFTKQFFVNLRSQMKRQRIKPYQNGLYGFVFNPGGFAQFANDLQTQERILDENTTSKVSKMLQFASGTDLGGEVSGLKGIYNGFMLFEQNVYGVGATPGTDAGVTSVTVASTPTTFDTNFAFGANTIAKATSLPVEIRQDEVRDFGRRDRFVWYSHEGYGDLDVVADVNTGKELRVIQVRNKR
jgi:hypothetical protein